MRRAILLLAVATAFLVPSFASLAAQVDGLAEGNQRNRRGIAQ